MKPGTWQMEWTSWLSGFRIPPLHFYGFLGGVLASRSTPWGTAGRDACRYVATSEALFNLRCNHDTTERALLAFRPHWRSRWSDATAAAVLCGRATARRDRSNLQCAD